MIMVPTIIMVAEVRTRWIRGRVRTRAFFDRGGRVITAGSTGSTPSDWAGGPSIRISESGLVSGDGGGRRRRGKLTNPQDLHGIQRVLEAKESAEEDQG